MSIYLNYAYFMIVDSLKAYTKVNNSSVYRLN